MTRPTISAGTKFAVSASVPEVKDLAGFSALNYTQIRGVRSLGDIGKHWQTITRNPLGSRLSYQQRVGYNSGSLPLELVRIADTGQRMLRKAVDSNASYSYRAERRDGSVLYFTAQATTRTHGGFEQTSIADTAVTLEIDSEIVEPE